jgi:hypothetical protein
MDLPFSLVPVHLSTRLVIGDSHFECTEEYATEYLEEKVQVPPSPSHSSTNLSLSTIRLQNPCHIQDVTAAAIASFNP